MIERGLCIVALLLLAGCAKPLEVANITEISSKTGSTSIDVHEPKRRAGQAGLPEFAGDQLVEVRAFTYQDGNGEVEMPGATCTVSAADFSATTQTPAKVRVPLYRGQSSTLAVACEKAGYAKKMITLAPIDVTRTNRMSSGAGGGLIGVVAVAAIDSMSDNTKNEWRYPLARVVMERAPVVTSSIRNVSGMPADASSEPSNQRHVVVVAHPLQHQERHRGVAGVGDEMRAARADGMALPGLQAQILLGILQKETHLPLQDIERVADMGVRVPRHRLRRRKLQLRDAEARPLAMPRAPLDLVEVRGVFHGCLLFSHVEASVRSGCRLAIRPASGCKAHEGDI